MNSLHYIWKCPWWNIMEQYIPLHKKFVNNQTCKKEIISWVWWLRQENIQFLKLWYFQISKKFHLKLVFAIFYQFFIFSPSDRPSKTEKCFLFHLKSSFCSWDIQIFVIFPLPFCTSRFKRTNGSEIIYDVMNWRA